MVRMTTSPILPFDARVRGINHLGFSPRGNVKLGFLYRH
jgi:hypothetical protein